MALLPQSPKELLSDEIRRSAPAFIKAATEAFSRRFALEYYRLRGYSVENQSPEMELHLLVRCNFAHGNRSVAIEATPRVNPQAGVTVVKVE